MRTGPGFFNFLIAISVVVLGMTACESKDTPSTPAANPYSITGTLSYTGSLGPVGSSKRMAVFVKTSPNFNPVLGDIFSQTATNGAAYTVDPNAVGTYYLLAFFGALSLPCEPTILVGDPTPMQGDPYYFYNGSVCGAADPLTITSGQPSASVNISFDDTCLLSGVSGSVAYTGSHAVSSSNGVVVLLFTDSVYGTRDTLAYNYLTCSSTNYNLATNSSSNEYLMAFVDLAGTGLPASGDPYIKFGSITQSPTLTQNLSFNDTTLLP